MNSRPAIAALLASAGVAFAMPPNKVLFDATKAEMAGNADWVIDADTHNIGTRSSDGAMIAGLGTDSNPQRFPSPAQSTVTAATAETYWQAALSSWAIALVKRGMSVETLPIGGQITYLNAANPQDLSNYSVYIVDEPNIRFTAAEKTAIINWVRDGGGLFMIADHTGSDRNSDGADSLQIWNDLMSTNTVLANPFGISFNSDDVSPTSTFVDTAAVDPIIHGPAGNATELIYHNGCTITVSGAGKIAVWSTATHTSSNGIMAYSTYGVGRIVALGDSSPFDDGTGDTNDTLFSSWTAEAGGNHAVLGLNATIWLNAASAAAPCYANCDASTIAPILNANDFQCFLNAFAAGQSYANCDGSTVSPTLNANDFQCFLNAFATGCS